MGHKLRTEWRSRALRCDVAVSARVASAATWALKTGKKIRTSQCLVCAEASLLVPGASFGSVTDEGRCPRRHFGRPCPSRAPRSQQMLCLLAGPCSGQQLQGDRAEALLPSGTGELQVGGVISVHAQRCEGRDGDLGHG